MNHKAFTLIELLVVVAIIGILAAVGVVAYNGYTKSAKKAVIKNQHSEIVKFITLEKTKCETINTHQKLVTASGGDYEPTCSDFLNISQMPNNVYKMSQHLIGIGFKNPLEPSKPFHQYSGDSCTKSTTMQFAPGCTIIDCSTCAQNKGSAIMTVKTCLEGSCTNTETLTDTISFE